MGDLGKNFSRYEVQCSCGCGASWVSPKLIEKLQHVRDVVGKPMTITSGVRCESFNASIKGSLVSSHMPDADGMGLAVDIACITSKARYEMVDVAIKFFRRIGDSISYDASVTARVYDHEGRNVTSGVCELSSKVFDGLRGAGD